MVETNVRMSNHQRKIVELEERNLRRVKWKVDVGYLLTPEEEELLAKEARRKRVVVTSDAVVTTYRVSRKYVGMVTTIYCKLMNEVPVVLFKLKKELTDKQRLALRLEICPFVIEVIYDKVIEEGKVLWTYKNFRFVKIKGK